MSRRFLLSTRLLALVILTSVLLPNFTVAPTFAAPTHPATDGAPQIAPATLPPLAARVAAPPEPPHPRKLDSRPQPLAFLSNAGQTDGKVKFHVQGLGGMLFFTQDEVVLAFPNDRPPGKKNRDTPRADGVSRSRTVVRVRYEGATGTPSVTGVDQLPGVANYLIGNDAAKWRRNVSSYASVVYTDLYPGIDLRYDGARGQLKSTYTIAPGADPSAIRWRYTGAADARVDDAGNLVVSLPDPSGQVTATAALTRTLIEHTPLAWQEIAGQRVPVTVRYTLAANQRVGFAVGAYDPSQPLVLDPTFSTYLGGSGAEEAQDVAVDVFGNVYITGSTNSSVFPTLNPEQNANGGNYDAFVAKYNESGIKIYATYFGGNSGDYGESIAVDNVGAVYVTGRTNSTDLAPVPSTPIQAQLKGSIDAFVIKLNDEGNTLLYSTYLGGDGYDVGWGIAVESTTYTAYVTGSTNSALFPGALNTRSSYLDAFIARLNPDGTAVLFSRYHGGNDNDEGFDVALDSNKAYITGLTWSTALFPTLNGYQTSKGGGSFDAFVAAFDPSGALVYSTYLGGDGSDSGEGIAVLQGSAYITGHTESSIFPGINANSLQSGCGDSPCRDAFVAKLDYSGGALLYSTYLGGNNYDYGMGIAVTSAGIAYVAGLTQSGNFPTMSPFQASLRGTRDAFVAVIDPSLPPARALRYSTYLGGSTVDQANGIALDPDASIYVTGSTSSNDFPTFNQYQNYASSDAFVAKLSDTIGFRDFSAGAAGGDATADKPQSKLWWNDGIWWAVMFSTTDNKYQIYKLNWPDKWVRTPAAIDDRAASRADALWDGTNLYVVSVVPAIWKPADPLPPVNEARIYRYSYNTVSKAYTLDTSFPKPIMTGRTETMTIAKDSLTKLWVAYTQENQVWYQVSTDDGVSWTGRNLIPNAPDVNVSYDDIASVVAFNGKIGVLWSDHDPEPSGGQGDPNATYRFAYRDDSSPSVTTWQPATVVALPANRCASDDHINLKSLQSDSSGRLYAGAKTSFADIDVGCPGTDRTLDQVLLLMRKADGTWTWTAYGTIDDELTRPSVLLDSTNNKLYMFATSPEAGNTIYMKSTNLDNPSFSDQPGLGRAFISSGTNLNLNNPTTTKQILNGTTDLVVLATDELTHEYMHNVIDLPGQAPPPPVTNMLVNGSFELDANADGRPDSWSSNSKFTRSSAIPAIDGSYVGRFFATDNSGTTISQRVSNLTAGTTYNFSGRVNIPATSDAFTFKLEVRWLNASDGTISTSNVKTYSAATSGWDSANATLVAPANATKADMRMNVSSLNATIYVDNLTFSTGAPPADTTPPTVTSTTPAAGATSVQVGQNAVAVFSEAVNGVGPSSFTLTPQGGSVLATTVIYDSANKTAALDPNANLLPNTTYTAQLTAGISDLAGNTLTPVSWSFTTAAAADTTPPTVTSKTPAAGATGVVVAANITAVFSEAVTGVSSTSFTLVPQAGGAAIPATVTLDAAGTTATLNPTADLAASTAYTAQLSGVITDAANNGLMPVSWSFTTGTTGGTPVSFGADADTYVSQEFPGNNYATNSQLQAVGGSSTAKQAFLRFTVTGLPAGVSISSAKLRLYVTNDSTSGGMFNRITNNSWAETITWVSKPAVDGLQVANLGAVSPSTFIEVDLASVITGNGTYSFAITLPAANTNTLAYASKEASTPANRPQLIVTTQ